MASLSSENRLLFNYHDAILYESDFKILTSPREWLNDACIHFGMTLLAQKHNSNNTMFLMDPSVVSYFMHQCIDQDEIQEFLNGNPCLKTSRVIFIPINNNHGASSTAWHATSGTHWSLLVIIRRADRKREYLYFDSVQGSSNRHAAQAVANKFANVLSTTTAPPPVPTTTIVECKTPQQENGYDCGLHVLAATEYLAHLGGTITADSLASAQFDSMLNLRKTLVAEATRLAKDYANG